MGCILTIDYTKFDLHKFILEEILSKGFAPKIKDICLKYSSKESEVVEKLLELQAYHGVVLHPQSHEIWVIHPFSTSPTNYLIKTSKHKLWSNCAWCSLGASHLINEDVDIFGTLGGEEEKVKVSIKNGELENENLVVHFPIKMKNAWDNVIHTCSMMHFHKSEADVKNWCERHGFELGNVQPISKIWEFSKEWYGSHLNHDWKKWSIEEAVRIFKKHGLDGPIWSLKTGKGRF